MCRVFKQIMMGIFIVAFSITGSALASDTFVHFIVVPVKGVPPEKMDASMSEFKVRIAEMAGGYTALGKTEGGYQPPGGELTRSGNFSFMVAAPRDLTEEVLSLVGHLFNGNKAFILVWPAKSSY